MVFYFISYSISYLSPQTFLLFGFIKMQFLFVKFVSSQFLKWQLWSSVWEEYCTNQGKIILIAIYPVTIPFC